MQSNQTMEKAVAVFGELRTKANATKDTAKGKAVIIYHDLKDRSMEAKDKVVVLSIETGFTVYKYKVKAQHMIDSIKLRAVLAWNDASQAAMARVSKVQVAVGAIASQAKEKSIGAMELANAKSSHAYNFATTSKVGVTSTSAAAGAVVGGMTTGALGTVAGAAAGIIPAVFTFGLSIPAGAMIGLCAGTAVGGSVGAVSGGAIGYTGFTRGKAISEAVQSSLSKAGTKAANLKIKTLSCASGATKSVRTMVRGSTGGAAHDKDD